MPTYIIDGKKYSSDTPLTDAELEELSGGAATQPSTGAVVVEALRKGITNIPAYMRGAAQAGLHIAEYQAKRQIPPDITGAFLAGVERVREPAMRLLGGTGAEPVTGGQRIAAGAAEAVTDPTSYLFGPLAQTQRLGILGRAIMLPTEQAVIGAGATSGGIAGQYAGEKMGAPTAGALAGSLFGGAGAAAGLGSAMRYTALSGKAFDASKKLVDRLRGGAPEDELLRDVDNRINNVFTAAGAADPNFM
jgi:hypothetical protein